MPGLSSSAISKLNVFKTEIIYVHSNSEDLMIKKI